MHDLPRTTTPSAILAALLMTVFSGSATADTKVTFDVPDSIECRDVTPENAPPPIRI